MIARIPQTATLEEISEANPGWKVERESDGSFTMSPTFTLSGFHGSALIVLLANWVQTAGGFLSDSSAGYTMPDTAVLSPDAAWTSSERWNAATVDQRSGYAAVVPNVCVEVASQTDRESDLIRKLMRYRAYGATYVLLVDPFKRTTWSDGTAPAGFPTDFTSVFDAGVT